MSIDSISLAYLPVAVGLGALHALEPGHAKTMTAAYLVGINGRWTDAVVLGLAAATTHSLIVVGLAVGALLLGREAFADEAMIWLQVGSGILVLGIGLVLLVHRLRLRRRRHRRARAGHHDHDHDHDHHHHDHHDHDALDDDAHARAHAARLPAYVGSGRRPGLFQVLLFGAAGGLVPCPASVSVMLLALSVGSSVSGLVLVGGFSVGLAVTLVGVGLVAVAGFRRLGASGRFARLSGWVPELSAGIVALSGVAALAVALAGHHPAPAVGG